MLRHFPGVILVLVVVLCPNLAGAEDRCGEPPRSSDAVEHYRKAMQLVEKEAWAAAILEFQRASKSEPDNPETLLEMGIAFGQIERWNPAVQVHQKAVELARGKNLDLVQVASDVDPPVCRMMDYGKYKYDLAKKSRQAKAHRHETELKEVRIKTPKIDTHDLMIKVNRAKGFLLRGDRVQFSLRFRGRELAHVDEGQRIFNDIEKALEDCGKVDRSRREGRRITMLIAPLTKQQLLQKRQAVNLAAKIASGKIPDPSKAPPEAAPAPATEAPPAPAPQAPPAPTPEAPPQTP